MDASSRSYLLELRHLKKPHENIPLALIKEVILALPDDSPTRKQLLSWTKATEDFELSLETIRELQQTLAEFAHMSSTELGEVERLPHEAAGRIVARDPQDRSDGILLSSAVVLSLAIGRFLLLSSLGMSVYVVTQL